MSLVRIEEYCGSVTGNAVKETLGLVGILNTLANRGYSLGITGIQKPTPLGFIDDEPEAHTITIDKVIYIGKKSDFVFIKGIVVDKNSISYKDAMAKLDEMDLKFRAIGGAESTEKKRITVDADGVWYRHTYDVTICKDQLAEDEYVKYMFESIASMIVELN